MWISLWLYAIKLYYYIAITLCCTSNDCSKPKDVVRMYTIVYKMFLSIYVFVQDGCVATLSWDVLRYWGIKLLKG